MSSARTSGAEFSSVLQSVDTMASSKSFTCLSRSLAKTSHWSSWSARARAHRAAIFEATSAVRGGSSAGVMSMATQRARAQALWYVGNKLTARQASSSAAIMSGLDSESSGDLPQIFLAAYFTGDTCMCFCANISIFVQISTCFFVRI